eukprot:SAG22_NODE_11473_length_483_cov_1.007812_1_plen_32_part_10
MARPSRTPLSLALALLLCCAAAPAHAQRCLSC